MSRAAATVYSLATINDEAVATDLQAWGLSQLYDDVVTALHGFRSAVACDPFGVDVTLVKELAPSGTAAGVTLRYWRSTEFLGELAVTVH